MSSTSTSQSTIAGDSLIKRALLATPILLLSPLFYVLMTYIDSDSFWKFIHANEIIIGSKSFKIAEAFHGSEAVDRLFHGAVSVLSVSTFGWDGASWWQTFSFLIDVGTIHSVFLVESSRKGNTGTPAQLPLLFGILFQTLGIGTVGGIYFFWLYVLSPPHKLLLSQQTHSRHGDRRWSLTVLPLILLFSTLPIYQAYHAASLQTRHWYMWAWQLFPLYISVGQHLFAYLAPRSIVANQSSTSSSSNGSSGNKDDQDHNDKTIVQVTIVTNAAISAAVWLYTITRSPYSLRQLFVPDYFFQYVPRDDFVEQTRHFLKWDQVCGCASALLWLVYSAADLQRAKVPLVSRKGGKQQSQRFSLAAVVIVIVGGTVAVGPAATFALGWLWREQVLLEAATALKASSSDATRSPTKRSKAFR